MAKRRHLLIALRARTGLSQGQVAEALGDGCRATTVSSWETGQRRPMLLNQQKLAGVYGVRLYEVQQALGIEDAVDVEGHLVQPWLTHYDSLVYAAGRIGRVQLDMMPNLLQTKDYSTMVERSLPGVTDEQVAKRVAQRMERQLPVHRHNKPVKLVTILDEIVLRRRTGGPEVMAPQLDHLVRESGRANVEIRVVPDDGRSLCISSSFELLTKPDDTVPFMAITADECGACYHEGVKLGPFREMWRHAGEIALSPDESIDCIQDIRGQYPG